MKIRRKEWGSTCWERNNKTLMDKVDVITYTGHPYTKGCMFVKNHYLFNKANLLLANFDGQSGGLDMTVKYAKEMNIRIYSILLMTCKMRKTVME